MTTIGQQQVNSDSDGISLKELILKIREWWYYLLSKWFLIVLFGILGGFLGFIYAYLQKPVYIAVTTFVLEEGEKGGGLSSLASVTGIDFGSGGGGIFEGDNILELYKSRTMIEKTLLSEINVQDQKQLLIDRYIAFNHLRESWAKQPELKNLSFSSNEIELRKQRQATGANGQVASNSGSSNKDVRLRDSIMGVIVNDISKNYLSVSKPDKKLSIIRAEVKATDELFAKAFNNQIVKNVNDFYVQTKTKKSLANVTILQHKTDSVKAVMNGAVYSSVAIADATPNLNPTRQIQRIAPMQRSQLTAETNKLLLGELAKNLEMSKMSLLKETPLIQVVDDPIFPLPKERLGKLKGIICGGVIVGILAIIVLIVRRILKQLLLD